MTTDDTPFQLQSAPLATVSTLSVLSSTGSTVSVEFATLSGNRPSANANQIALWQGTTVPLGTPPQAPTPTVVDIDSPAGSQALGGLDIGIEDYVLAYLLGPLDWNAPTAPICATAGIDTDGNPVAGQSMSIGISPGSLGPTSLVVAYQAPSGYLAKTLGNWIGLFEGHGVNPFSPLFKPVATAQVGEDSDQADVPINYQFRRNWQYTLVCFAGAARTAAAAMVQFQTAD